MLEMQKRYNDNKMCKFIPIKACRMPVLIFKRTFLVVAAYP